MNLNLKQFLALAVVVFSVLAISTTGLGDIFGPKVAKSIAAASNILNAILAGWLGVITGQASTIASLSATQTGQADMAKALSNVPGIEPIKINKDAPPALAQLALDPTAQNVAPVAKDAAAVTETASSQA